MKKYSIIYADPPWELRYVKGTKAGRISTKVPYHTLNNTYIKELQVKDIVADNAILFLWGVDSRIPVIPELMVSWGFTFKTVGFVWNKVAKHTKGVNATLGTYTRKSCEFCFIGTRGKCIAKMHTQNQYFPEPRRKHSQKPDGIRDNIVTMCGDLPRIELFAREKHEGWDVLGNDIDGKDIRESLQRMKRINNI